VDYEVEGDKFIECPSKPEESWRRLDPHLFFLERNDILTYEGQKALNGLADETSLSSSWAPWRVFYQNSTKEELITKLTESLSSLVSKAQLDLLLEESHRLILMEVTHRNASLLFSSELKDVSLDVISKPFTPTSHYPKSDIGQKIGQRLQASCPQELELTLKASNNIPLLVCLHNVAPDYEQSYLAISYVFEAGTKAQMILLEGGASFALHSHHLYLKEKAEVEQLWYYKDVTNEKKEAHYLGRTVHLSKQASFKEKQIFTNNTVKNTKVISRIAFEGERASHEGGTVVLNTYGTLDYEPLQDHIASHGSSSLNAHAMALKKSRFIFQGLIKVETTGVFTTGSQINKNLLLSKDARIDTIPRLEIEPNEVSCKHGSAVANLDPKQVYYLMTRGLSKTLAYHYLLSSFAYEALKDKTTPKEDFFTSLLEASLKEEITHYLKAVEL
jgi:Fe-S cluster assembly protein SufD